MPPVFGSSGGGGDTDDTATSGCGSMVITEWKLMPTTSSDESLKTKSNATTTSTTTTTTEGFLTFQELQDIEWKRRDILQRVELPLYKILTYWTGTCLRALALDWLVWLTIFIFGSIRYVAHVSPNDEIPAVFEHLGDDTNVDILGGFLSFLLVIYVNQTNTRFFDMYSLAKASSGRVQDVVGLVCSIYHHHPKTTTTDEAPQVQVEEAKALAYRMVRYMNAAHIIGYVGLGGPYTKQHFFDEYNKNETLLTKDELNKLQIVGLLGGGSSSAAATFKELVTWCQRDVQLAQRKGYVGSYESQLIQQKILDFRASMDGIYDYCDQPPHFFYIHFLCLLSALYLPIFAVDNAYSAGWGDDSDWSVEIINFTIVVLQSIFVVGLRLLGQKMIDPFGDDYEDLSVLTYVETTLENCRIISNSYQHHSMDIDVTLEQKLRHQVNNEQTTTSERK